jgi:DegV family protein with EDD domain
MISVVTDSTGYLPQEIIDQYNIRVVPLNVHFEDGSVFREGIDLTNEEFYQKLVESKSLPTTSQPSPAAFQEVFEELTQDGNQVICTVISTKMSGTYQSAVEAQRSLPDADIAIVDTQTVAGGLGFMTLTAAEMAQAGSSMQDIVDHLEQLKQEIGVFFTVDTLEYLHKGGRIGTASAMLGTLLKVKPILTIRDGIVQPVDKVRSRAKALQRIVDELAQRASANQPGQIIVMHALVPEEAEVLKTELQKRLNCSRIMFAQLGSIVGTHAGPGVIGGVIAPTYTFVGAGGIRGQEMAVPAMA